MLHFFGIRNCVKLEIPNKSIFRIITNSKTKKYITLLDNLGLVNSREREREDYLTWRHRTHKFFKGTDTYINTAQIEDLTFHCDFDRLRGQNIFRLPRKYTSSKGRHSFKFYAPRLWNILNDQLYMWCQYYKPSWQCKSDNKRVFITYFMTVFVLLFYFILSLKYTCDSSDELE